MYILFPNKGEHLLKSSSLQHIVVCWRIGLAESAYFIWYYTCSLLSDALVLQLKNLERKEAQLAGSLS